MEVEEELLVVLSSFYSEGQSVHRRLECQVRCTQDDEFLVLSFLEEDYGAQWSTAREEMKG